MELTIDGTPSSPTARHDNDFLERILVAEDDPVYRHALEHFLTADGYQVRLVGDGLQALEEALAPDPPRLLVLDWIMPGLQGPQVCARLREQPAERYQYMLLLTAKDSKADVVAGLQAGADDYLTKPFDANELLARVRVGSRIIQLQDGLLAAQEALRFQATHDPLTGVWNRRALLELSRSELERSQREFTPISLFMIDLDRFKQVNDNYGHVAGDSVLRETGQRLAAAVRPYDVVGRYGGEEFVVVASALYPEHPRQFAERLRTACSFPIATSKGRVSITVSLGVATAPANSDSTIEKLIQTADAALYAAKRNGRNRVEIAASYLAVDPAIQPVL